MTQTPAKVPPLEQVRFCQIQCVRDTPQTGTLSVRRIETTQSGLVQVHVFMVTDADQHHSLVDHNNLGNPHGITRLLPTCDRAELPEPRHSDAKQLDVYNTSQPLPSSLTEVYSDPHLLGRGCS